MTDDDKTRRIDPDDADATRAFDPFADEDADEATQVVRGGDEATRRMAVPAEAVEPTATQRIGAAPVAADGPRTERIPMAAQRSIAGWMIALAILVALMIGAAIGYSQGKGNDSGELVQRLVSTDGGVLTFDGKGELNIPKGALPTATAISIRKVGNPNRVRLGSATDGRSRVYEKGELDMYVFEPAGLQFQQPVRITLPRQGGEQAAILVDAGDPRIVAGDVKDDRVTFETSNFAFDDLR